MGDHREWAQRCNGSTPVSRVAELALASRLADVDRYVLCVANGSSHAVESVHQLRVSARRANAALSLFSETLPKSGRRKWKRKLHSLRQSAGRARDLDVMRLRLLDASNLGSRGTRKHLRCEIRQQRLDVQPELVAGCMRWQKFVGKQHARNRFPVVQWRSKGPEPGFRNFAAESLSGACHQFLLEAVTTQRLLGRPRRVNGPIRPKVLRHLHQLRITGKRAKYAMELLEPGCGFSLRDGVVPILAQFQNHLGSINDHAVAIDNYRTLRKGSERLVLRRALKEAIRWEEHALVECVEALQSWWSPQRTRSIERCLKLGFDPRASN